MNLVLTCATGLYTDESPGLKVDPVVVLVLSLVFIFSVVALHSKSQANSRDSEPSNVMCSHCKDHAQVLQLDIGEAGREQNKGERGHSMDPVTLGDGGLRAMWVYCNVLY